MPRKEAQIKEQNDGFRLKKSLDFLSMHIDRYPYREMCDATFPLSKAAEALDKSERREVTRAALLPQQG